MGLFLFHVVKKLTKYVKKQLSASGKKDKSVGERLNKKIGLGRQNHRGDILRVTKELYLKSFILSAAFRREQEIR